MTARIGKLTDTFCVKVRKGMPHQVVGNTRRKISKAVDLVGQLTAIELLSGRSENSQSAYLIMNDNINHKFVATMYVL